MSGVDADADDATRLEECASLVQGGDGLIGPCGHSSVFPGKIAQIEDYPIERLIDELGDILMAGTDDLHPMDAPRLCKEPASVLQGLLLDVEGPDLSCCPHQLRQEEGVMAVAAGGIDNPVPFSYAIPEKVMRKANSSPQTDRVRQFVSSQMDIAAPFYVMKRKKNIPFLENVIIK
jgi:hypothetical protein